MKRAALIMMAIAAASFSGCAGYSLKRPQHAMHGGGCPDGCCQQGCPGGNCPADLCVHGCGPTDGHSDPCEPCYFGHQGPPQRSGLLSWLGRLPGGPPHGAQPAPGPSAANVSYPYYTTRGPRDFLASDPRGIGP